VARRCGGSALRGERLKLETVMYEQSYLYPFMGEAKSAGVILVVLLNIIETSAIRARETI